MTGSGAVVRGVLDAPSRDQVVRQLRTRGLFPLDASESGTGGLRGLFPKNLRLGGRVTMRGLATATQELSMPPTIGLEQAKGFSLYMLKAIISGRGDEVLELGTTNVLR